MDVVPSTMLPLGTKAPDFDLPSATGGRVSRDSLKGRNLVVMFLSSSCPYVEHIREELARFGRDYEGREDIAIVAINSNDPALSPEDDPDAMADVAGESGFTFPYLWDETQEVARRYRASCTPDFFIFDRTHVLCYRGQFDPSRPDNDEPVTGTDLRAALEVVSRGAIYDPPQNPSYGCPIKWKAGQEPEWFRVRTKEDPEPKR